jgi:hypothetical protein
MLVVISSIKIPNNTVFHSPEEITLVFMEFYETLYKSEGDAPATVHEFLNKLNVQTLIDENREHLEKEITSKGIHFQHCWGDITGVRRTPC